MPVNAVLLLLASALVHATWNLQVKRSGAKGLFLLLAIGAAAVLYLPAFVWLLYTHGLPAAGLPFLLGTCGTNLLYFVSLGRAYSYGDISFVYPINRGSGLAWTAVVAVLVFHEPLSAFGGLGVSLVLTGILFSQGRPSLTENAAAAKARRLALFWALINGVSIAANLLIDRQGTRYIHPFLYAYLEYASAGLVLLPAALRAGPAPLLAEWRARRGSVVAVGALMIFSYVLTLFAMRFAAVSYVAAVRELSIVFATAMGMLILKEPASRNRLAAALLITLGVILIGLRG